MNKKEYLEYIANKVNGIVRNLMLLTILNTVGLVCLIGLIMMIINTQ